MRASTESNPPVRTSRSVIRRRLLWAAYIGAGLPVCLMIGTCWHEVVGHGLVGVMLGARLKNVHVLGIRFDPRPRWEGWTGYYGYCNLDGTLSPRADAWMKLAGALSTWIASAIAIGLLWARTWPAPVRHLWRWVGIWWIDMFTYTLPTWGVRRSILWGGRTSEPAEAAVALGMQLWLFQMLVIVSCGTLAALWITSMVRARNLAGSGRRGQGCEGASADSVRGRADLDH